MDPFVASAREVVEFKFLGRQSSEILFSFKPLMTHQIFGEGESVFGYRDLQIHFYYHYNSFYMLLDIKHLGTIRMGLFKPDDIHKKLLPWISNDSSDKLTVYEAQVSRAPIDVMYGNCKFCFQVPGSDSEFSVTHCKIDEPGFSEFHHRFETLMVWFIDAANFIDREDRLWDYFYLYEKKSNGMVMPVGFCTVYKFIDDVEPDGCWPRLSQFFILPPYHQMGLGKRFYHCVYTCVMNYPDVRAFTVENPTEVFKKMKTIQDCRLCLKSSAVIALIKENDDYNDTVEWHIYKHFNFCKLQTRKIYYILKYHLTRDKRKKKELMDKIAIYLKERGNELNEPNSINNFYNNTMAPVLNSLIEYPDEVLDIIIV